MSAPGSKKPAASVEADDGQIELRKKSDTPAAAGQADVLHIALTAEQRETLERWMQPGFVWIGKLSREMFDGQNIETSGRLFIEFGVVPESALPALREAVAKARGLRAKKVRVRK